MSIPPDRTTMRRLALMLLVIVAYGGFVAQRVRLADGGFSNFISAGDRYVDRARLDQPIYVEPGSDGYDGQFVYRFALDPLTSKPTEHGITLDLPSLRAQRIGYPALAYLLSLGDARLVPFLLVAINLAALALLTWSSTGLALLYGRPSWYGLIVPIYPGLLLSLSRDTTEVVSVALAVTAIGLALRDRYWRAGIVACLAVLTRETTLLYVAGFGIAALIDAVSARRSTARVAAFLLPLVTIVAWQMVIIATWGHNSFATIGNRDFGLPPLRYMIGAARDDIAGLGKPHLRVMQLYRLTTRAFLIAQVALAGAALSRTRRADWRIGFAWACYAVMALFFTDAIWIEPWGFLRVSADLYTLGCILLLASPWARSVRVLIAPTLLVWAVSCWFVQA